MKKKIIVFFVCMLFVVTVFPVVGLTEDNEIKAVTNTVDKESESLIVTLESASYTITTSAEEKTEITMEGYGYTLDPGCPKLPSKIFLIGVPPGGEVTSVELIREKHEMIPGIYNIVPAPPVTNGIDTVEYEINEEIYSSLVPYPTSVFEYLGMGQLRKYSFARIRFSPISYVPAAGKLVIYKDITLKIKYNIVKELSSEFLSDTVMDDVASEIIVNYPSIHQFYIPSSPSHTSATYDYVIITTSSLESSIIFLKNWKEFIGYEVKVVTISWISSQYAGSDLEEKIRNFLIDKYSSWGIEYVLIVGSHSTIPMRYCYPDKNNHGSSGKNPTDYYYADLTGNWDSDGDGYYGERDHDSPDFNAEVWVGRIPVDTPEIVEDICQKTIDFEQDIGSWKKKALLCGPILNYANEDHSGWPKTDDAELMEELWNDVYNPNGFSRTTMYEKEGLSPSIYSCDYGLSNENIIAVWPDGYGIVNLGGHGNEFVVARKVWDHDDGDGVPEAPEIDEIIYFSSYDCDALNDDKPSIVFSSACSNAYPENSNNLGKSLLVSGSVAFIGATRIAWATVGWDDESEGGNQAIAYYFIKYLVNQDQSCGEALYNCKLYYWNHFDWWDWRIYQNLYDSCLYGDPAVSLTSYSGGSPPDIPSKPSGPEIGRPFTSYTYSTNTTDPDGHEIFYKWDWGDGSFTDWLGPYDSGVTVEADHEWTTGGEYMVKVKAKDCIGTEGSWSESLEVTIELESDLECTGDLTGIKVEPGTLLSKEIYIKNIGPSGSLLDWEIIEWPDWGDWGFTPIEGYDLRPEDGQVTVQVFVKAPDEGNEHFSGHVTVVNKENAGDFEILDVSLSTPRNKQYINTPFLNFLENHPILYQLLQRFLQL